jgi:hypothetical protein
MVVCACPSVGPHSSTDRISGWILMKFDECVMPEERTSGRYEMCILVGLNMHSQCQSAENALRSFLHVLVIIIIIIIIIQQDGSRLQTTYNISLVDTVSFA